MSAAYLIVRKRNLTPHRVKKTAQAWKIISFAGIYALACNWNMKRVKMMEAVFARIVY